MVLNSNYGIEIKWLISIIRCDFKITVLDTNSWTLGLSATKYDFEIKLMIADVQLGFKINHGMTLKSDTWNKNQDVDLKTRGGIEFESWNGNQEVDLKSRLGMKIETWNRNQDVESKSRRGIGIKNLKVSRIVFQDFREYSIGMKSRQNLEYTAL